jgi:succinate dehydrogenase / fumarate reductase iron-sulfur subunit
MASTNTPEQQARQVGSHAQIVKPGRLPVSEFAFDRAGAASPFGDDVEFPIAVEALTYRHPTPTE